MSDSSLESLRRSVDSIASHLRNTDVSWQPYVFPDEYTNWIEEQRAVREAVAVVDQSYHQDTIELGGDDVVDFLSRLSVNSPTDFENAEPPFAKNLVMCNHDGYLIGDVIAFYLPGERIVSTGAEWIHNWIRYNASVTDRDVACETVYDPFEDADPREFRFQVQGPEALDVLGDVTDGGLPEIGFFEMDRLRIDGVDVYALGHGMAGSAGLEIFGPYERHDDVLESILAAGESDGIRQLGSKAYKTGKIGSGWFLGPVPAIYTGEELREYREWLDVDGMEASMSIGGSFASTDIADYYITPFATGQAHLIAYDHEFVGRAALEAMDEEPTRERVTLVWDDDDVVDTYASLFAEGAIHKFIDLPDTASRWSETHYDAVRKDGELVGISKYPGYLYYTREMLSLAAVDEAYSEPGTEVVMEWGERTDKRRVERHEPTDIRATVAPSPYVRGGRIER
jgi:vanillate/3-O-methylgallate O-demethylase